MDRRTFGMLGAAGAGGSLFFGCGDFGAVLAQSRLPRIVGRASAAPTSLAWRLLNRAGYGPRPGDLEAVETRGAEVWLEEQLTPERIPQSKELAVRLGALDSLALDHNLLRDYNASDRIDAVVTPLVRDLLKTRQFFVQEPAEGVARRELIHAAILRATYSTRRLEEVLLEFWSDHFHVSQAKSECEWLKTVDHAVLRPHVFGRFRDLLGASAHSPAMLFYLDNDKSGAGDELNENYGRELLELHTLGVDAGYTLKDVQEVSRCFTGWGVHEAGSLQCGAFEYKNEAHDDGAKVVLGHEIPAGGGYRDGEGVLDILAAHPATARFICGKLCRRFISDQPPPALIEELAGLFMETDGDLRAVVRALFLHPAFTAPENVKFKRPFDFVISALRATNATLRGTQVAASLGELGQLPFQWATPDGYPDEASDWSSNLLGRWNFAVALSSGGIEGADVEPEVLLRATKSGDRHDACRSLQRMVLGYELDPSVTEEHVALSREAAAPLAAAQWLALTIASPEFQLR